MNWASSNRNKVLDKLTLSSIESSTSGLASRARNPHYNVFDWFTNRLVASRGMIAKSVGAGFAMGCRCDERE